MTTQETFADSEDQGSDYRTCSLISDLHSPHFHWRGNQTSPTVVSLKGRLPEITQSKSTLSCDIIQIHSLFHHDFIKKPKSKFNQNRK